MDGKVELPLEKGRYVILTKEDLLLVKKHVRDKPKREGAKTGCRALDASKQC